MPKLDFPDFAKDRGAWFWARPKNLLASRRKFMRQDQSNVWRYAFEAANPPAVERSAALSEVIPDIGRPFRIAILGDTGEGDRSQYTLLPLLRAVRPDLMVINGDVAYPAGELDDFTQGFFRPYTGLNIPVWATVGNHEYYSDNNGRNFYDVFCTRIFADQWSQAGLRLVPQPGMYWELRDPSGTTPLVILGLDSGKSGNLDGHDTFLSRIFAGRKRADDAQHRWLDWRLSLADTNGSKVVVLFHIPALVQGKHDSDTHLGEVHRVLARHASVRAVCCGHIHNHQQYLPATLRDYMAGQFGAARGVSDNGGDGPQYIVNGNGGAALEATDFGGPFATQDRYPSVKQWRDYTGRVRRAAERTAPGSVLARAIAQIESAKKPDDDPWGLQSFLLLDVNGPRISVSRIFVDDLTELFKNRDSVRVENPEPPLDRDTLRTRCTQALFEL